MSNKSKKLSAENLYLNDLSYSFQATVDQSNETAEISGRVDSLQQVRFY